MRKCYHLLLLFTLALASAPALAQEDAIKPLLEKARLLNNRKIADSAIFYTDSVLKLCDIYQDHASRIKAMRIKGKSLFTLKKEKEAVSLYFAALRLCKSPGDDKEIAWLYGEIGYAYYIQGHSKESKSYYKKEIAILTKLQGKDSLGNQYINMAVMHQQLGELDSSQMMLNEVRDILSRNKDSAMRGYYYFNMGAHHTARNQPDSARHYYLLAHDIWKALDNKSQLFKVTFNLGFYYFQKNDYQSAIKYYLLSLSAAQKHGMKRDIAHVYGTMAESYAAINDHKNAYKYLYLYATLNDSFAREDINNYVLKLDKQYETDKNRELIQAQELEIKTSTLAVQKHRNTTLTIIIIFVLLLFAGAIAIVYSTFRNRVRKKVEEAKGRFFANVAHEIRTPLSMIQAPIELLQNNTTDPAQQQQLAIAARNTQRLNDLINQMLDISKLDAARYTLHNSVGNLEDFAKQLFVQYTQQAKEKNITLTCHTDANTGNVLFDKDALEKILNNLVGNAIKYTQSGGAAGVELTATETAAGVQLQINVWDTGNGIPAEDQAHIFERFYRSPEQQKAGVKGIGIGLALVKELVTLMNGTLSVTSEPGKGSVFTVACTLLPAATIAPNAAKTDTQAPIILLAEDDTDILSFNKALMEDEGYHVLTATNGNEAISLISTTLPDLIVTDLMMPGMDGLELLKAIRASILTAHIPVIILSARASAQAKTEGVAEGAQAYLPKPFSPAELKGLVKNQLQLLNRQKTYYQTQTEDKEKSVEERYSGTDPFTQKCYATIQEHLDDPQLSVEKLAELMNINRSHFQRKIKTLTGYSPSELIRTIRLEKARDILLKKENNITETAYATGFTSQSYFTKCFSEHFGYPPSQMGEH